MTLTCPLHATPDTLAATTHPGAPSGARCPQCHLPATATTEVSGAHHCPCCAAQLDRCPGPQGRAFCARCGPYDAATAQFERPDELALLLAGAPDPDPLTRPWRTAIEVFGPDIVARLERPPVGYPRPDSTADGPTTVWALDVGQWQMPLRFVNRRDHFEAGSFCPVCEFGIVWTPVTDRAGLLAVYLYGPGPGASGCNRRTCPTHSESAQTLRRVPESPYTS